MEWDQHKSSGPKGKGLRDSKVLYRLQETNTDITDIMDSKVRSINARIRDYKVRRINTKLREGLQKR
jgi:hypothetical protein